MKVEYSQNNGHLTNTDMTSKVYKDFAGLFKKAIILFKSLTKSKIRILSSENSTEIKIHAAGKNKSEITLTSGETAGIKIKVDNDNSCEIEISDKIELKVGTGTVSVKQNGIEIFWFGCSSNGR